MNSTRNEYSSSTIDNNGFAIICHRTRNELATQQKCDHKQQSRFRNRVDFHKEKCGVCVKNRRVKWLRESKSEWDETRKIRGNIYFLGLSKFLIRRLVYIITHIVGVICVRV